MKNLVIFLFCLITVFLQISVAGLFFSRERIPDLALAMAITLVLTFGFKKSFGWILLVGIFADAGSNAIFGTVTLAFFLLAWMISEIAKISDLKSQKSFFFAALAALVAFAEIGKDLILLISLKTRAGFMHESIGFPLNIFSFDYGAKIAYTVLAVYAVYFVFQKTGRTFFHDPIKLVKKY
jgi:rod shape-determining protein MreD